MIIVIYQSSKGTKSLKILVFKVFLHLELRPLTVGLFMKNAYVNFDR